MVARWLVQSGPWSGTKRSADQRQLPERVKVRGCCQPAVKCLFRCRSAYHWTFNKKIACGFARVSVSSPSRYFVREQCFRGRGLWRVTRAWGRGHLCGFRKSVRVGSVPTLDPRGKEVQPRSITEDCSACRRMEESSIAG